MRAPLSWIKEFVDVPSSVTAEQISDGLIRVGFEVEEIIKQGADLTGPLKFAKVLSIEEITEFKKPIRYVGLDCGEGETRYVICGATNFAVGDLVVAALPGAVLPGDFKIGARETYGKTSNGMICSARELGISDDHEGIMVFAEGEATIGADAIEAMQINDVIFDVAVDIYFPLDGDRFNPNFKSGKSISNKKQLESLKKSLKSNKNWTVKGIAINGFASPEGELQRNSGLSQGRANSTFSYMKKELKELGFTEVNDQNLTMGATLAEDWTGLAKLIEASSLKNKAALIAIISNNSL